MGGLIVIVQPTASLLLLTLTLFVGIGAAFMATLLVVPALVLIAIGERLQSLGGHTVDRPGPTY